MEFVKKNIKWIALGGCLFAIIALFLPFATVSAEIFGQKFSESVNYVEGDGAIVFAAIVVAGVLIFLKKDLFSLIPLGIGAAITVYSAVNVGKEFEEISVLYGDLMKVGFGIGFYLLLVGLVIAAAAMAYSHFVVNKNGGATIAQPMVNQMYGQQYYNQSVQPGYNQTVQPNYGMNYNSNVQPTQMGNNLNSVDNNIFNQAPVAQTGYATTVQTAAEPVVNNQVQPVVNNQSQMVQPIINNVQTSEPVQNFATPAATTCPQCRATLNSGMSFCTQCGSKIN